MRSLPLSSVLAIFLMFGGLAHAQELTDTFNDPDKSDFWYQIEADSAHEFLMQASNRLEFRADNDAREQAAYYLLRGSRISLESNFEMEVEYDFSKNTGVGSAWLMMGIAALPDTFIELRVGYSLFLGGRFVQAVIIQDGGIVSQGAPVALQSDDGKMYISYIAGLDRLILSVNSAFSDTQPGDFVLEGVLAQLDEASVAPYIGGASDDLAIAAGEAFLDDFIIQSADLDTPDTNKLEVASSPNSSVQIAVSPADNDDLGDDVTPFTRTYDEDIPVTLAAPLFDGMGNGFLRWLRNGSNDSKKNEVAFAMTADREMEAVYVPVSITLDYPNDAGILIQRGQKTVITWTSTGFPKTARVAITLVKNTGERCVLAESAKNSGKFKWKVDGAFPDSDDYVIEIAQADAGIISESMNPFAIGALTDIEIFGPATVDERETAQYVAIGSFTAGADQDISSLVKWSTDNKAAKAKKGGFVTGGKKVLADTPVNVIASFGKKASAVVGTLPILVLNTIP